MLVGLQTGDVPDSIKGSVARVESHSELLATSGLGWLLLNLKVSVVIEPIRGTRSTGYYAGLIF